MRLTSARWQHLADTMLTLFLQLQHSKVFRTEHFRVFAERHGLPTPKSLRAYGPVVQRALKAGRIERVGFDHVINPNAHQAVASVWRAAW